MGHRRQGQDTGMSWPCLGVGRTRFVISILPLLRTCCTASGRTGVVCPSLCLPQALARVLSRIDGRSRAPLATASRMRPCTECDSPTIRFLTRWSG